MFELFHILYFTAALLKTPSYLCADSLVLYLGDYSVRSF